MLEERPLGLGVRLRQELPLDRVLYRLANRERRVERLVERPTPAARAELRVRGEHRPLRLVQRQGLAGPLPVGSPWSGRFRQLVHDMEDLRRARVAHREQDGPDPQVAQRQRRSRRGWHRRRHVDGRRRGRRAGRDHERERAYRPPLHRGDARAQRRLTPSTLPRSRHRRPWAARSRASSSWPPSSSARRSTR